MAKNTGNGTRAASRPPGRHSTWIQVSPIGIFRKAKKAGGKLTPTK